MTPLENSNFRWDTFTKKKETESETQLIQKDKSNNSELGPGSEEFIKNIISPIKFIKMKKLSNLNKDDFNNFIYEHQFILDYIYNIVVSINADIDKETFYKWSFTKTNVDYGIKEILKYNRKIYNHTNEFY